MRNLAKTLAVVSLLVPASGYSLGIGDIKLHSALNQNLDAEISLVLSAGENASDIKVNLAPPVKFEEAGVPWTSFLSDIRFKTVVGVNGSVIIKLSSENAVKEPFLDFLLEVNWPKGSLYREFTVLLDPPTAYQQVNLPVLASSESYKPKQVVISQRQSKHRKQLSTERSNLVLASENGSTRSNDTLWNATERASSSQSGAKVEHRRTKIWKNRPLTTTSNETTSDNQLTPVASSVPIAPDNEQVTAKKKVVDATSNLINKEVANVASPVKDTLQNKVTDLEKQLAIMQKILALKDQQVATLQNQIQTKPAVQPEAVQEANARKANTISSVAQQKPFQHDVKSSIRSEPKAPSSRNTYYIWVGGVSTGTLFLFGWLWWRKRKLDELAFSQNVYAPSSINKISESQGILSTPIEQESAKNTDANGKSSFLSELTLSDIETLDMDQGEIDPVSEADVYLAYGRYQQAEELMRDVIKDQPSRDDCKLKLLEIYCSNENKHAFETYAYELVNAGKKDDVVFWAKVAEMGSKISQDSTLFSAELDEFIPKEDTTFEKKTMTLFKSDNDEKDKVPDNKENNFSLFSDEESFNNEAVKKIPETTDILLDIDLISFDNEEIDEQKNNESIDFDLSTISTKTEVINESLESIVSNTEDSEVKDKLESFYLDLNEIEVKRIDENDSNAVIESFKYQQDFYNLNSLNDSFADDSLNADSCVDRAISSGLNGEGFEQQDELNVFDLTDIDELETKLDLAKAYIDISDIDAAKDMACDALEKGSAEQKKIAQVLLNNLNAN